MVKKFVITTHMEVDAPIEKVKEVIWSLKKCGKVNEVSLSFDMHPIVSNSSPMNRTVESKCRKS